MIATLKLRALASLSLLVAAAVASSAQDDRKQLAEKHYANGFALSQQGRLEEAIAETRQAVVLNANHPEAQYNLGFFLSQKGQLDEAITRMRLAIKLKPAMVNANFNLAYFLSVKGKKDEAIKYYKETLKLAPDNANAHFNLGILYTERKLPDGHFHCRRAAELDPKLSGTICNKG